MGKVEGMDERAFEPEWWLQIEPQHCWHEPAFIRGNAASLRALAAALVKAADKDSASMTVFASDGEGYRVEVLRVERPDDFPTPFYIIEAAFHENKERIKELMEANTALYKRIADLTAKATT